MPVKLMCMFGGLFKIAENEILSCPFCSVHKAERFHGGKDISLQFSIGDSHLWGIYPMQFRTPLYKSIYIIYIKTSDSVNY